MSGWEEGAAGWTPMDGDTRLLPGRGEGWRPLFWASVLVQAAGQVRGCDAFSKLASTSTCLGLRVLEHLHSMRHFPGPRGIEAAGEAVFP